jgi:hypothetical protein
LAGEEAKKNANKKPFKSRTRREKRPHKKKDLARKTFKQKTLKEGHQRKPQGKTKAFVKKC